jgi:glycine/D-amino acid oxidase-like deaminating enzyme/nitrite reductase/ring-hydroxylating ferredoxin subunit
MSITECVNMPVWRRVALPTFSRLTASAEADVCIVGAGIAGLTAAYLLAKAGRSVVVLDAALLAGGETERTTAHLTDILDKRYYLLEWLHGERGVRLAAASHRAAIAKIQSIAEDEQIACDFALLDGYLFDPPGEVGDALDKEWKAAHRAGLSADFVDRAPWPDFNTGPCLRFPDQAQFHPLKYLAGLASAITRMGGRIFTQTQVKSVSGGPMTRVQTATPCGVNAAATIVATNTPINDRFAIHTKQAAYRTYVLGLAVPKAAVPAALYWDTADPYHYVRIHPGIAMGTDYDLLIVGGEDHKTGQDDNPESRYTRLEQWTRDRFPMAGDLDFRWSGQVLEPNDGLAYIGRNPGDDNVYIVTVTSGNGMTYGIIAGLLLTDLILGRENPWAEIYKPSRVSLRAAGEFLRENLNVAAWYTEHLTGGDVDSPGAIPRGTGGIVRRGLSKVAVYRDEAGNLHEHSAVCPHLGGIVHWNPVEKSWDCPLHGSRFDVLGHVINGPATANLKKVDEAES